MTKAKDGATDVTNDPDERRKKWRLDGSTFLVAGGARLADRVTVRAALGTGSATLFEDDNDPTGNQIDTHGFDDGFVWTVGADFDGDLGDGLGWRAGLGLVGLKVQRKDSDAVYTWEELGFAVSADVSFPLEGFAPYVGLRYSDVDGSYERDRRNPLDDDELWEFEQDQSVGVRLGIRTVGGNVAGHIEVGFVDSTTLDAGVAFRF